MNVLLNLILAWTVLKGDADHAEHLHRHLGRVRHPPLLLLHASHSCRHPHQLLDSWTEHGKLKYTNTQENVFFSSGDFVQADRGDSIHLRLLLLLLDPPHCLRQILLHCSSHRKSNNNQTGHWVFNCVIQCKSKRNTGPVWVGSIFIMKSCNSFLWQLFLKLPISALVSF